MMTILRSTRSDTRMAHGALYTNVRPQPRRALSHHRHPRRAFSLVEVLLAIFILGVGVISIAALFPAGIAQQRLSVDDMIGATVANNAIEVIRSKVRPEDFGSFEDFFIGGAPLASVRYTIIGDWSWGRPVFFADDATVNTGAATIAVKKGSISIFKVALNAVSPAGSVTGPDLLSYHTFTNNPVAMGLPWSYSYFNDDNPNSAPLVPIIITQRERYFPMASESSNDALRPQYVWDCMFRRFQGRILVAIFVYRVTMPGGGAAADYAVASSPSQQFPSLPIWLGLMDDTNDDVCGGPWSTFGLDFDDPLDDAIALGTRAGLAYNPDDPRQAWQHQRQWMIDQNNSIHRVLGQTRQNYDTNSGRVLVELVRPPTPVQGRIDGATGNSIPTSTPFFYRPRALSWLGQPQMSRIDVDVVTDVWYLPLSDENGLTLTPVYATVKEL